MLFDVIVCFLRCFFCFFWGGMFFVFFVSLFFLECFLFFGCFLFVLVYFWFCFFLSFELNMVVSRLLDFVGFSI